MEFQMMITIGLLVLLAGAIITLVGIYNSLIAVKANIANSWANIDVILKQRYDEIPKLIEVCEQYAAYEAGMVDKIMRTREKMVNGKNHKEKIQASNDLTYAIKGLMAIGEGYPDLKVNTNFLQIQNRLSELEETLADRREFLNNSVTIYNVRIQQFPDVYFARQLGYESEFHFKVEDHEKDSPSLKTKLPRF